MRRCHASFLDLREVSGGPQRCVGRACPESSRHAQDLAGVRLGSEAYLRAWRRLVGWARAGRRQLAHLG
eukprot:7280637-Alexandrium_andersonii.AAC.1